MKEKWKQFWHGIKSEWKKISWPTKKNLVRKTSVIVAASALLGGAIVGMDYISQHIVNLIIGILNL